MEDGELIASWEPETAKPTLVLRFEDMEEMHKLQARLTQSLTGYDDEGARFDRVETAFMGNAQLGRRDLLGGEVVTFMTITTRAAMAESEEFRRAALLVEQKARAAIGSSLTTTAWKPSDETIDWLEKWADEVVGVFPAGGGWSPKNKTHLIREGFNAYVTEHGRSELALRGTSGGRAFSDFVQKRFRGAAEYVRSGSNVYLAGLYRRPEAKKSWFPGGNLVYEVLANMPEPG